MARRKNQIQDPNKPTPVQTSLFMPPGVVLPESSPYPHCVYTVEECLGIVERCNIGLLGLDLEFRERADGTLDPTVIGIANEHKECGAIYWDDKDAGKIITLARKRGLRFVAYSLGGADKPAIENGLGIKTSLEEWEDAMVDHWLCNPDFTKSGVVKSEDEDDVGVLGLMGLWTAGSMYTMYPQHKECRGSACFGPCPRHNVRGYCAQDSLMGLDIHIGAKEERKSKGIPHKLYRETIELGSLCEEMHQKGMKVDRAYIADLEKKADEKKFELFPYEQYGKNKQYKEFNPKSHEQVLEWADKNKIVLPSTDKNAVRKALEKEAHKFKIPEVGKQLIERLENESELPETVDVLFRLDQFKNAGKGLKSWFDESYISKDDLIHARFNHTGTSMGRLSSSNPNATNIPARGFGALVRNAIVVRSPHLTFIDSDYSQGELRLCLWAAGVDPKDIQKDAFIWLVQKSNGAFKPASDMLNQTERQTAKSVAHAFDYLEGIKVITPSELMKDSTKKQIEYGALRIYAKKYNPRLKEDWFYRGGLVAFTGANLSERLFGNKTWENRKKALEIQEDVFAASFPMLRDWQWKVLQEVEARGAIQDPCGFYLPLYGTPEEDAKMATACIGQGTFARHVQGMMLRFRRELGVVPVLQVHDSLMFEEEDEKVVKTAKEYNEFLMGETDRLPGFVCPAKTKIGKRWGETKEIGA